MDPALSKALKKREYLLSELKKIDQFIELFGEIFGSEGVVPVVVPTEMKVSRDAESPSEPRRKSGKPAEIAKAAESAIRKAGRPLSRGKLVEAIEAEGISINSSDKARYVGTVLWRESERFENVGGEGYWLRGETLARHSGDSELFRDTNE